MRHASRYSLVERILFPSRRHWSGERMRRSLSGKTVVITGASFGIGEQLAYALAGTGAKLVLVARTGGKLAEVQAEVERRGGLAQFFVADFYIEDHVRRLCAELAALPGGVDIFVSNAGKSIRRPIFDSLERYHDVTRTMAVNCLAPVQLLLTLIPLLTLSQGQIINISAMNVLLAPAPYWAAYQSSKTAFDQWLRCAVPELRQKGVTVSSVYLPLVRTRMVAPTAAYRNAPAMSPEHAAAVICRTIAGKSRRFAPWWSMFPVAVSRLLPRIWENLSLRIMKSQ